MTRSRRRCKIAAAVVVLVVSAGVYVWVAPIGDPDQRFDLYLWLAVGFAIPVALWLTASVLLIENWWARTSAHDPTMDAPGRLLATAVATLSPPRQCWGRAMLGELSQLRERAERWRFVLSCFRAMLVMPFARNRQRQRARLLDLVATLPVIAMVVASVVVAVAFVREHPAAAEDLPPNRVALVAVALTGCIALALISARRFVGRPGIRQAPHLGAVGAVVFAGGVLVTTRFGVDGLVLPWLLVGSIATFLVPAWTAATAHRSFLAGVCSGTWTAAAVMPLTFAVLLAEASRQYARDGQWLFAGDVVTAGFTINLTLLIVVAVPMIGFPFAVIGAKAGAPIAAPPRRSIRP